MKHRRAIVRAAGVVGAAWVAFEVVWSLAGEPAPFVDYGERLGQLVAAHQPEGRDGWSLLDRAARAADDVRRSVEETWEESPENVGSVHRPDFDFVTGVTYDESKFGWELRAIEAMRDAGVMDLLSEAAACPRFVRELEVKDSLFMVELPNLARFRGLAKTRAASMRIAFHRGDLDEAVTAFEHAMVLGRAAGAQPFVIDRLVALAVFKLALAEITYDVVEHPPDAGTCRRLIAVIDRHLVLGPSEMGWEAERAMQLDIVQRTFTDDGHGDGRMKLGAALNFNQFAFGVSPAMALNAAGRRETTDLINEWAEGMIAISRQTPTERVNAPAFDEKSFAGKLSFRHAMLSVMMTPVGARMASTTDEIVTCGAATKIMIALEGYRAEHGAYPATLGELVPVMLDELPIDPSTDASFVYRYPGGHPSLPYMLFPGGTIDTEDADGAVNAIVRPIDDEAWE